GYQFRFSGYVTYASGNFPAILTNWVPILVNQNYPLLVVNGHNGYRSRVLNVFSRHGIVGVCNSEGITLNIPDGTAKSGLVLFDGEGSISVFDGLGRHGRAVSSSSRACSRAELESACPASIRASSEIRHSPVSSVTSEVVKPASMSGALLTRTCLFAYAATWGRWVTTIT